MKPENLECVLHYYIKERSKYDVVDGFPLLQAECFTPVQAFESSPQFEEPAFSYAPLTTAQEVKLSNIGKKLVGLTDQFFSQHCNKCSIKFEDNCLFVKPEKQTVSIPVIRSSCTDVISKVTWKTSDKTAISNVHYIGTRGEIVFDKGETKKFIEIEILNFSSDANDLRFQVQLCVENSAFDLKPMTVNLKNIDNFSANEKRVIENLLDSTITSVNDMMFILRDCFTQCTFHTALSYLCSTADSLPLEVGLACEFTQSCLHKIRYDALRNILTDFFRFLPDDLDF